MDWLQIFLQHYLSLRQRSKPASQLIVSGGFMAKSSLDDSTADAVVAVVIVSVVVLSVVEWLSGLPA